jgi:hypothetical protein
VLKLTNPSEKIRQILVTTIAHSGLGA